MLNVANQRTFGPEATGQSEPISTAVTFNRRRALVAIPILLCLLPCIQLGLTYWISVQGLAFVVVLLAVDKRLRMEDMAICALTAAAMLIGLIFQTDMAYPVWVFMHNAFQALGIFVIVCAAKDARWSVPARVLKPTLAAVVLGLLALTLVQYISYTLFKETRFLLPSHLYVSGQQTIASDRLAWSRLHGFLAEVRVSATYAEPSYLGFILLCLTVLVLNSYRYSVASLGLLGALLATAALSKSASAVIMIGLLVIYAYRRRLNVWTILALLGISAILLIAAATILDFDPIGRLLNSVDPRIEPSGYVRLIMPLQHVATVLTEAPLGVPWSDLGSFFSHHAGNYTMMQPVDSSGGLYGVDNGLLNLVIQFGWAGFLIIGGIVAAIRDRFVLLFLLLVMQFNGAAFSPDKVAMICLALASIPNENRAADKER